MYILYFPVCTGTKEGKPIDFLKRNCRFFFLFLDKVFVSHHVWIQLPSECFRHTPRVAGAGKYICFGLKGVEISLIVYSCMYRN